MNISKKTTAFGLTMISVVALSSQVIISPAYALPPAAIVISPGVAAAMMKISQMPCMNDGSCIARGQSSLNRLLSLLPRDRKVYWSLNQREMQHARDYLDPSEGGKYACTQILQPRVSRTMKSNFQYVGVSAPIKWPSREGERVNITCVFANLTQ
jgi:hypothetical protein